ncbi:hypothetical protein FOZ61_001303 [Perkinsus olseni]|uniref:Uncharacterized protein n=1 Tax=Perkinsus olseni TaxID=32597 RepID=A0A7J6LYH6_PEROL|nr:hypothetical protein FOL46_005889 [Perkinsus olseni]KAF4663891.1 hypothetical protein FOZ61_001303 [Perkinsus olseni]
MSSVTAPAIKVPSPLENPSDTLRGGDPSPGRSDSDSEEDSDDSSSASAGCGIASSIASRKTALLETLAAIESSQRARVAVESKLEAARSELARLEASRDAMLRENELLTAKRRSINAQLEEARKEIASSGGNDVVEALASAEARTVALREEGDALEAERERTECEVKVAQLNLAELKKQLDRWQGELDRIRAAQKEAAAEDVVNDLKEENAALREKLVSSDELERARIELTRKEAELAEEQRKVEALTNELALMRGDRGRGRGPMENGGDSQSVTPQERLDEMAEMLRESESARADLDRQLVSSKEILQKEVTALKEQLRKNDQGEGGLESQTGRELHAEGVEDVRAASAGDGGRASLVVSRRSSESSRSVGMNTPMKLGIDAYAGTDRVQILEAAVNTDRNDICDDGSGLTWAERDRLAREVAELKTKAIEFSNKASRLAGLEQELKVLENKKQDAVDTLAIMKRQLDDATKAKGQALATAKAEKEQLLQELDNMHHEKRQLEKIVHDLQKSKESLCQEEEAALVEYRDAERRRGEAIEKLQVIQEELKRFSDTKQELMEAQKMRDSLVDERERITVEMKSELDHFKRQEAELREVVKGLESEHDRLRKSVASLVQRRQSEDAVLSKIVEVEKDTESEARRLQGKIKSLMKDICTLTTRRDKADAEIRDAYSLLEQVGLQLADKESQRDGLSEKLCSMENRLTQCEKERTDILEEIQQLHHFRDKLEVKCDVFAKDFDRANGILDELRYEISMLERRRDALHRMRSRGPTKGKSRYSREHAPGQPYECNIGESPEAQAVIFPTRRRRRS